MKNLTMQQLKDLGFEIVKNYRHDHFITQRRKKGFITVETTYDRLQKYKQVSQVLTIDELFLSDFTFNELNVLSLILNK